MGLMEMRLVVDSLTTPLMRFTDTGGIPTVRTVQHWIAGKATSGSGDRSAPVFNPATGAQQAEVLLGSPRDVEAAIDAAKDACGEWSQT